MPDDAGLLASARRSLAMLIGVLATRFELLANEWQEERLRWAQMLLLALFATVSLCMGVLLAAFFLVVLFWDEHRLAVLAALSLSFFVAGSGLLMLLLNKLKGRSNLFAASLAELNRDREYMGGQHE